MRFYTNVQQVGNSFLVRGYDNDNSVMLNEEYSPTLFVKSKIKTKYKTLEGAFVEPIQPGFVKECREFYKKYQEVENFKIYGNDRYINQYISDKYPEDEINFDISKIKIAIIDIETTSENGFPDLSSCEEEILLITIQDYVTKKIITWGTKSFTYNQSNLSYIQCDTESSLLSTFLQYWVNNYPDIISGWNTKFFDLPYIYGRLERLFGEKQAKTLSPWKIVNKDEEWVNNRQQVWVNIYGIGQLDYLELYKKFTYKARESYRLDYICEVELEEKKLDHSEFSTFKEFYTMGWNKFVSYNIKDVELVGRLEDKMKLIELAITMAYDAKVNYSDVFYQVRMWDSIIYNYLKKKNIVIPPREKNEKTDKYAGAYVKEPVPGIYDWIVSFDLNSLYPSLIMEFNVSPETLVADKHPTVTVDKIIEKKISFDEYKNYSICPNGAMYRKDIRGFLPELMEKMFKERSFYKKKMLEEMKNLEEIDNEIKRRN